MLGMLAGSNKFQFHFLNVLYWTLNEHEMIRAISRAISQLSFLGGPRYYNPNPRGHSSSHDCPGDLRPRFVAVPDKNPPSDASSYYTIAVATSCSMREKARYRRETIRNLSRGAASDCPRIGSWLDLVPMVGCCPSINGFSFLTSADVAASREISKNFVSLKIISKIYSRVNS